jgi:hypothetical protein
VRAQRVVRSRCPACFESVDGVEDAVEFVVEDRVALEVEPTGKHHIDGGVEVDFGLGEFSLVIVGIAAAEGALDLLDKCLGTALFGGDFR